MSLRSMVASSGLRTITYVVVAVFVFAMWVWGADTVHTSFNGDPRSTLSDLIYGRAENPFVQRALIPTFTRALYGLLPQSAWSSLRDQALRFKKVSKELTRLGWEPEYLPEYMIALLLALGCLVAFPFVLRAFFNDLYITDESFIDLVPAATLLGLPLFFHVGTHYIYDFPATLLFSLGLLLLIRRKWIYYYPALVIGCINKETMILLAVAFVLVFHGAMKTATIIRHLAIHGVLFAGIKSMLMSSFGGNGGALLEFHLFGNLHSLLYPYSLAHLVTLIGFAVLAFGDFGSKHKTLRRLAWLIVPFGILMLCFAWLNEIRDLYELIPIYSLLIAHTILFSWMKIPYTLRVVTA